MLRCTGLARAFQRGLSGFTPVAKTTTLTFHADISDQPIDMTSRGSSLCRHRQVPMRVAFRQM